MAVGLSVRERSIKRVFDLCVSIPGLIVVSPLIVVAWVAATIDTRANGFYVQRRIGRNGRSFPLFKIRSMRIDSSISTTVTTGQDKRITKVGTILRKTKLDELPQLANVVLGHMSLVGPRPDVAGFADKLQGDDRVILTLRPGITGPASLAFRDEEELLAAQDNPEQYNRDVIWPRKIEINRDYLARWTLTRDFQIIVRTLIGEKT
ncbi:sugar transferase [Rhodopirellula sallentina]|uniref:Bacterial sugar transferase n=1 Tax=Rhodopirellula sallentina SM41 TaxID=1263870 RepID=M5UF82_9BACT|nr:sugar transferase [Rhodopirellula sallentina]EMI56506.1 bacterial sugar transferase [Rhodopirellula sallentina SM41]